MALSVTRATVKSKCRISVTDFDSEIDALISEQLPVIEFAVLAEHVADTGNTGLQSTLNLGAAEVISGEFLAQSFREPGASEELRFADFSMGIRGGPKSDPFGLKEQGWTRLEPYLKPLSRRQKGTKTEILSRTPSLNDEETEQW